MKQRPVEITTHKRHSLIPVFSSQRRCRGLLIRLHALVMFFMTALQGQLLALTFYGNRGRSRRVVLFGLFQ
jgi:hypothetical protein